MAITVPGLQVDPHAIHQRARCSAGLVALLATVYVQHAWRLFTKIFQYKFPNQPHSSLYERIGGCNANSLILRRIALIASGIVGMGSLGAGLAEYARLMTGCAMSPGVFYWLISGSFVLVSCLDFVASALSPLDSEQWG